MRSWEISRNRQRLLSAVSEELEKVCDGKHYLQAVKMTIDRLVTLEAYKGRLDLIEGLMASRTDHPYYVATGRFKLLEYVGYAFRQDPKFIEFVTHAFCLSVLDHALQLDRRTRICKEAVQHFAYTAATSRPQSV